MAFESTARFNPFLNKCQRHGRKEACEAEEALRCQWLPAARARTHHRVFFRNKISGLNGRCEREENADKYLQRRERRGDQRHPVAGMFTNTFPPQVYGDPKHTSDPEATLSEKAEEELKNTLLGMPPSSMENHTGNAEEKLQVSSSLHTLTHHQMVENTTQKMPESETKNLHDLMKTLLVELISQADENLLEEIKYVWEHKKNTINSAITIEDIRDAGIGSEMTTLLAQAEDNLKNKGGISTVKERAKIRLLLQQFKEMKNKLATTNHKKNAGTKQANKFNRVKTEIPNIKKMSPGEIEKITNEQWEEKARRQEALENYIKSRKENFEDNLHRLKKRLPEEL